MIIHSPAQLSYISKEWCAQFLPNNPVILEAGGNKGRDTLQMINYWPEATVYAFEPSQLLFPILQKNIALHPSIHLFHYALSDTSGTAPFYMSTGTIDAVSSLLTPGSSFEKRGVQFIQHTINTITIDDWAYQYTVPHIDFMWLDLQGAELMALHGASKILKTTRAVHSEVSLETRYANAPLYNELRTFMERKGFYVAAEALYQKTWGNVLFIQR